LAICAAEAGIATKLIEIDQNNLQTETAIGSRASHEFTAFYLGAYRCAWDRYKAAGLWTAV